MEITGTQITEILKLGLTGIAFLFVFMTYKLLEQEQKQETPRDDVLKHIRSFITLCVIFAILIGSFNLGEIFLIRNSSNIMSLPKQFDVSISDPKDETEVSGNALIVRGKATFESEFMQMQPSKNVNFVLYQNNLELLCYAREVSSHCKWCRQPKPIVNPKGEFECLITVGEQPVNLSYQIIVIAVAKGSVTEERKHFDLPFYFVSSNTIRIKRVLQQ